MELYRITQEIYCNDLTGNGAKLFGGRWNSEGFQALYTASSRSLALLETLAHTPAKMLWLKSYMLVTLFVPDTALQQAIDFKGLPERWDASDIHPFTQKTGDNFLYENNKLLLSAPSVLMQEENIFVLNPLHYDMKKVNIIRKREIRFDHRMANNL
jgi:RES domain-containing protein